MSHWDDVADWIGPTKNMTPGGMGKVKYVVLHIQAGSESGSVSWEKNPASQVSSHFLAPKSGRLQQLVDVGDMAWAQVAGNPVGLSVENEGFAGDRLTDDQIHSCGLVMAKASIVFGLPLRIATATSSGLAYHGQFPDWGHQQCPGQPIIDQRGAVLARAKTLQDALKSPHPLVPWPGAAPFVLGVSSKWTTMLGQWCVAKGIDPYAVGPGPVFGQRDMRAVQLAQLAQGFTGADADGIPGPTTWYWLQKP